MVAVLYLRAGEGMESGGSSGENKGVCTYVPPFLKIRANDIIRWSEEISARTTLSVFLRILINSTGKDLEKVDFPGFDDGERPGWDGSVEAGSFTPWIPSGISGWEFGVTKDTKKKAWGDFYKSVDANSESKRKDITFVFVTPRRWQKKTSWVEEAKGKNLWKDVRAYDASDLEQWMEQSVAAQVWFANQTNRPSLGIRTLDQCWKDWADVAIPPLISSFFDIAIDVWSDKIKSFLRENYSRPFVIASDSTEESLAFISQVLLASELERDRDRVLVFDKPEILPILAQGSANFIAVVHTREVERELGAYAASLRAIVVYPRNATSEKAPDVMLEPPRFEVFSRALKYMGKSSDEINKLYNESGRSLTVLRRRLSSIPAIRNPEWAANQEIATGMVPLVLAGAWDTRNEADRVILSRLSGQAFVDLEDKITRYLQINDSPIWSISDRGGVVSRMDSLFAIASMISRKDLDRFVCVVRIVLGEGGCAINLEGVGGCELNASNKFMGFSEMLFNGISEAFVMLAVYGNKLFGARLGFDGEVEASKVIRDLLSPLTVRKLEDTGRNLPVYAEAAPREFLDIIDRDLRSDHSEIIKLLGNSESWGWSHYPRAWILWALEGLAWSPVRFPRVVNILGRLSQVEINDSRGNRPIESLFSILCAGVPQTAATLEDRRNAVIMILDKYPEVGWRVCIQQFGDASNRIILSTYKPKWRSDGVEVGEPVDSPELTDSFTREVITLALNRPSYTVGMLCDLLSRLNVLSSEEQVRVWEIIDHWREDAHDADLAEVHEEIRVTVPSRSRKESVYLALQPQDVFYRHKWLFQEESVELSADEKYEVDKDVDARDAHIEMLRFNALRDVLNERGVEGVLLLADLGSCQHIIGSHLASGLLDDSMIEEIILMCLRPEGNGCSRQNIVSGMLLKLDDGRRVEVYEGLRFKVDDEETLRFLLLFPYRASTWELVDKLSEKVRRKYWLNVVPRCVFQVPEENNESVVRLLEVKRPKAAFVSVRPKLESITSVLLVQLLDTMTEEGVDERGGYKLCDYDVQRAFQILDLRLDVSLYDKARLQLGYLNFLDTSRYLARGRHGILSLELYIEEHPELFVQALVCVYKRRGGEEGALDLVVTKGFEKLDQHGRILLRVIARIPGQDELDLDVKKKRLFDWVERIRLSCAQLELVEAADYNLGVMLSRAPLGEDGVWPSEPVRELLEELRSEDVSKGVCTGLYNARGIHVCGEGGAEERELADKYRRWADALKFSHPFVSSFLLERMVRVYEQEAGQQDVEAAIQERFGF